MNCSIPVNLKTVCPARRRLRLPAVRAQHWRGPAGRTPAHALQCRNRSLPRGPSGGGPFVRRAVSYRPICPDAGGAPASHSGCVKSRARAVRGARAPSPSLHGGGGARGAEPRRPLRAHAGPGQGDVQFPTTRIVLNRRGTMHKLLLLRNNAGPGQGDARLRRPVGSPSEAAESEWSATPLNSNCSSGFLAAGSCWEACAAGERRLARPSRRGRGGCMGAGRGGWKGAWQPGGRCGLDGG